MSLNSATSLGKKSKSGHLQGNTLTCSGFPCSLLAASDLASFSSPSQNQSPITQVDFSTILLLTLPPGANRFSADPSLPDNRLAQEAMNLTLYHWWFIFALDFGNYSQGPPWMGCLLPRWPSSRPDVPQEWVATHHEVLHLPTYWGQNLWMDWRPCGRAQVLNSFKQNCFLSSVIATMLGVSTTLGLGTVQINQGLHLLFPEAIRVTSTSQLAIIWVVTAIATVSVITGFSSLSSTEDAVYRRCQSWNP